MHDDIYQMYLDEMELILPCSPEEEARLLEKLLAGDEQAKKRLLEGSLGLIAEQAAAYADRGVLMGDLIQEANMALLLTVNQYAGGDFRALLKEQVDAALRAAIEEQATEQQVEEEVLARINVLKDISQQMAEELGREASVEELAEKMKMTVDEIKDIMKLTLDAMSVSPDAEI